MIVVTETEDVSAAADEETSVDVAVDDVLTL